MQDKTPLIIGFDGTTLDKSLANHLLKMNPAGILLFKRNITSLEQAQTLIKDIKTLLGDIIISIDHEGGIVSRFPEGVPIPPSPRALFKNGFQAVIASACHIQVSPLTELGVNLNFAPVVDLYGNQDSRVIGVRAFCETPEKVHTYADECIKAHEAVRIGTTAKHFPGHGSTETDTHFETGKIELSQAELQQKDLLPFIHAIKKGVPAIMTAHLNYPAFDKSYPASISKTIIKDLLRDSLNFNGLVITDCIEMAGLSETYTAEEILEKGLEAGVDLWISSFSFQKDRCFQLRLKNTLDHLKKAPSNQCLYSSAQKRIQTFLSSYQPISPSTPLLLDDAVKLSKQCIAKRKGITPSARSFHLVDLASQDFSGLNSQQELGGTASIIEKKCESHLTATSVISPSQTSKLEEIVKRAKREREGILLLSRNSFRHANYPALIDMIVKQVPCFHIALLSEEDLSGQAEVEWAVWGSNSTMAIAIAEEINTVMASA